jgi:hypothetical protein
MRSDESASHVAVLAGFALVMSPTAKGALRTGRTLQEIEDSRLRNKRRHGRSSASSRSFPAQQKAPLFSLLDP